MLKVINYLNKSLLNSIFSLDLNIVELITAEGVKSFNSS